MLWCNIGFSKDCSHIDHKKSKDEFVKCVKIEYQKSDKSFHPSCKIFRYVTQSYKKLYI